MLKKLIIMTLSCVSTPAWAEDTRLPELLHLIAASEACRIEPSQAALGFIKGLQGRLDETEAKSALAQTRTKVEAEIASQGPVTVCLTAWEKMRAEGFM